MKKITEKINKLFKESNLTKKEFGRQVGVSEVTAHSILNGRQSIKVETLEKIADVLDVKMSYFFSESDISDIEKDSALEIALRLKNQRLFFKKEKEYLREYEKQRVFYETIIKNREAGINKYYSLGKAFSMVIKRLLEDETEIENININQFETLTERFFGIEITKLYDLDTKHDDDYREWLKVIKREYSKPKKKIYLKKKPKTEE